MMTAGCTSWLSPWFPWWQPQNSVPGLFPGKYGLAFRSAGISHPSCLLTRKITLCTIIACVHFPFLEQVHGQKAAVGLYLKIITAFQDFSYLFDEMLALVDGAMNWQRGNLLTPTILFCSATSCESPHSPVSIYVTLFISFVCVGFKMLREVNIFLLACRLLGAVIFFSFSKC